MNQIQEAIARVTGLDEVIEQNTELASAVEHLVSDNALLQRQIEDLDYLNMFDLSGVTEVLNIGDRRKHLQRFRRMRIDNPLAKQSVQLIKRFTLGKGVEVVISPDPEKLKLEPPAENGQNIPKTGPGYPPQASGVPKSPFPVLARPRPQVGEAVIAPAPEPEDDKPLRALDPAEPGDALEDDPLRDIIQDFWSDPDNKLAFTTRESMAEWFDGVVTDGEKFFLAFTSQAAPYVKLTYIACEEIDNIIYNPDNWLQPVYYQRMYQPMIFNGVSGMYETDGEPVTRYYLDWRITDEQLVDLKKKIKLPARLVAPPEQRIIHRAINSVWTKKGKRGVSELYSSREWFRVYKEFMEDRAAINAAATSVAYKRKIKGGPTEVARFANKLGGINTGYDAPANATEVSKLSRPNAASVYDSNPAVDLEWMKTDTGAVNAEKDSRGLLAAAGAGVGMFVHYYGEGGDANLATAQAMELPMVKTFEDWQQWMNDTIRDILFLVLMTATDYENATEQIERVTGSFPPIISQDVVKYMTAWSQLVQNVASGNATIRKAAIKGALTVMNVANIDALMAEVEAEEMKLQIQRQQQHDAMINGLNNPQPNPPGGDGPKAARDGSSNAMPTNLKAVVGGKVPPDPSGPKEPK